MENAVTFLVVIVFLLIVYSYATGKIEKRKNRKEEKKAARLFPAAKDPEDPDSFLYARVLILPCNVYVSSDQYHDLLDQEVRMSGRVNSTLREIEDLGGHDVKLDFWSFKGTDSGLPYIMAVITCRRPHAAKGE